jgi:hypothetical protein
MAFTEREVNKVDILFAKFKECGKPRKNFIMERCKVNTRVQLKDETDDQYMLQS